MYLSRLGLLGRLLPDIAELLRSQIIRTVRSAFEPYAGRSGALQRSLLMVGARAG